MEYTTLESPDKSLIVRCRHRDSVYGGLMMKLRGEVSDPGPIELAIKQRIEWSVTVSPTTALRIAAQLVKEATDQIEREAKDLG